MISKKFTILITTKNRKEELFFTLEKIKILLDREDVVCIVCDDGSTDGTFEEIKINFPKIELIQNPKSQGLIYSRNRLMNRVQTEFAISIDDDLHFLSATPLEKISAFFERHPQAGILGFRIFWGLQEPHFQETTERSVQVKSFVGCAHVWRMKAWKEVPDYPDWFVFYGEEDFASYQLFKKNIEIHYLPTVLVHHRVEVVQRKTKSDYQLRLRRSFRSGWYLYFLFYPISVIPKKLLYTLWIQIKTKILKGDWQAAKAIVQAIFDVIFNLPKLLKQSNRLSIEEYHAMLKLPPTKIYWKPEDEK